MASTAVTQDLVKEKALQAQQIDTVFHLDLKMDNLKDYLQSISTIINQQSIAINQLQSEMKTKITSEKVEKVFKAVSSSFEITEKELAKKVSSSLDKPRVETTGDGLTDGANMISNRLQMLSVACSVIYKEGRDWDSQINAMNAQIATKINKDMLKAKVNKTKTKLVNEIDELKKKTQKQIDDSTKKTANELSRVELALKDTEKKTIWKINDCEALLQKRVTADYVDNTAKTLEEKLRREIQKVKEESFGEVFNKLNGLSDRCKNIEDQMAEKQKGVKKMIKDLEEDLMKKFCSTEKFETSRKLTADRVNDLDSKIALLDRRGSALDVQDKLTKLLKEIEEKIGGLQREDASLKSLIQDLNVKLELVGKKKGDDNADGAKFDGDIHKICALETELKRQKEDLQDLRRILSNTETDLRRKFDMLEHKVLSQFGNEKSGGVTREEAQLMCERVKIGAEEKQRIMGADIEDLKVKCKGIGELEKRLKKKIRELQDGGENGTGGLDWQKALERKAETDDTRREFSLLDEKIKGVAEVVNQFRREFETIEEFYLQLASMLKNNQQETISVITGNSRIIPNRCVACGTKGKQQGYSNNDMKGADGRIYRADFGANHQTSMYEQQEVFDVLPSQIGLPQINLNNNNTDLLNRSQLSATKQSVVSFKGRPTSAAATLNENNYNNLNQSNLQQSFSSTAKKF